jgi:hypothetical protein
MARTELSHLPHSSMLYAFVTLLRDHFIDGMRNVMTFVFVIQGRG